MPRVVNKPNLLASLVSFRGDGSLADKQERKAHSHAICKARGSRPHKTGKDLLHARTMGKGRNCAKRVGKGKLTIAQADIILTQAIGAL